MFKSDLQKHRFSGNSLMLLLFAGALTLYKFSDNIMRLLAHGKWGPPRMVDAVARDESGNLVLVTEPEFTDVASLGIEAIQPIFVAMFSVTSAALFASIMAFLLERMFRDQSFGTWSRYGIAWALSFLGFVWVVSSIM